MDGSAGKGRRGGCRQRLKSYGQTELYRPIGNASDED